MVFPGSIELFKDNMSCFLCSLGRCFQKMVKETAAPDGRRPPGALVLTKLVEWYRFEVGDEKSFFFFFCLLSWAVVNGPRAKTSRKTMRERVPPLQNSKNLHAKWAAKLPTFGALLSSFEGVERARA